MDLLRISDGYDGALAKNVVANANEKCLHLTSSAGAQTMSAECEKLEARIASLRSLIASMISPTNAQRLREYLEELEQKLHEQKAREME